MVMSVPAATARVTPPERSLRLNSSRLPLSERVKVPLELLKLTEALPGVSVSPFQSSD